MVAFPTFKKKKWGTGRVAQLERRLTTNRGLLAFFSHKIFFRGLEAEVKDTAGKEEAMITRIQRWLSGQFELLFLRVLYISFWVGSPGSGHRSHRVREHLITSGASLL